MKDINIFCFGFGQVAKSFIKKLNLEKFNINLSATSTNKTQQQKIDKIDYKSFQFANNSFDSCFDMLLNYYPKNKEKIKTKMLGYFDVLGFDHESTILYRKKLSSIMFS